MRCVSVSVHRLPLRPLSTGLALGAGRVLAGGGGAVSASGGPVRARLLACAAAGGVLFFLRLVVMWAEVREVLTVFSPFFDLCLACFLILLSCFFFLKSL